jgi:hypothetical protein
LILHGCGWNGIFRESFLSFTLSSFKWKIALGRSTKDLPSFMNYIKR